MSWLAFRIVLMAALIMAVGYWVPRHWGIGETLFGFITSLISMAAAVIGYLGTKSAEGVADELKSNFQKTCEWFVSPGPLAAATLVVVGVGSTISTVTVRAESVAGSTTVHLLKQCRLF